MGGKGLKKKGLRATFGPRPRVSMTLREEAGGKKQGNVNTKTMCKLHHLKNLAMWSAAKASIPSLGAFFGERLAAATETLGIRLEPSLFVCERCESILQPGDNCIVRIEKNKSKMWHRCCLHMSVCHFCSHRNLVRGTPKDYMKELCPPTLKFQNTKSVDTFASPTIDGQILETSCTASPLPITGLSLLDSKRRKRNRSGVKKVVEHESSPTAADAEKNIAHASSRKRKKRSWTSLKEIAQTKFLIAPFVVLVMNIPRFFI